MTTEPSNERVIDVWGYVQRLWAVKWTWLLTFVLVLLIGAAYALTRPALYVVFQSVSVTVPTVSTQAEATQQSSVLGPKTSMYQVMALRPPVTDAVLLKHPEIEDVAMLRETVRVSGTPMLFDVLTTGDDVKELSSLVQDVADNLAAAVPELNAGNPEHLQFTLQRVGDPVVTSVSSGRLLLIVATGAVAAILATLVAAFSAARRGS